MDGFPLEMLTQLSVILLVHFACLEIELQITYGGVQGVFLLQQTCTGRCTGVLFPSEKSFPQFTSRSPLSLVKFI